MKQRRQLLEQELKRLGKQMSQGTWDNQVTIIKNHNFSTIRINPQIYLSLEDISDR